MDIKKAREILGSVKEDSETEIKRRYKALARKWHPDVNPSKEAHKRIQEINKAYEIVMKEEFNILDPWKDYQTWWWKQYGNDPLWGNPTAEEYYGKTKKYPGVKKSSHYIESSHKNHENNKINKFLEKKNTFAVIGVSNNPKKYGNKVYKDLKFSGYNVYAVNPRIDKIGGEKCYHSIEELPTIPDVINVVVPPEITEKVVKTAVKLGIKKVWLQPGSESERIIDYCKKHNLDILHNICIMIEKNKAVR